MVRYSVVGYSDVLQQPDMRLDADFHSHPFRQKFLERSKFVRFSVLGEEVNFIRSGHTPYKHDVSIGDIPFITVECIGDMEFFLDKTKRLTNEQYDEGYTNKKINKGSVVCTIKRRICKSYPFLVKTINMTINQDVALIRPGANLLPGFLASYLNCSFGQGLADRLKTEQMNPYISLVNLIQLPVPLLSMNFQRRIEFNVFSAQEIRSQSEDEYTQAQVSLLSELGLTNWQPQNQLTFVKNYSDTRHAGRIDADYFQPRYEEIVDAIKSYPGGWGRLGDLVAIRKCVEVGSDEYLEEGVPFVRVSNLSQFDIGEDKFISDKLYGEIEQHQPRQGEILLSKDATPGIAHYLDQRPPKMIPSGGILRLTNQTDKVNNEYLTLVLNSILTKEQVNRDVGGSVIFHWRPDQVKGTVIPILPKVKQAQIQQKVTESFRLRKQSRHLLECAKRAVEIAIEQDEQAALDWLEGEVRPVAAAP